MTGWNLPPGCNVRDLPGAQDMPCAICWRFEDSCVCPECLTCGAYGDPECYAEQVPGYPWQRRHKKDHDLFCSEVQVLTRWDEERKATEAADFYAQCYGVEA